MSTSSTGTATLSIECSYDADGAPYADLGYDLTGAAADIVESSSNAAAMLETYFTSAQAATDARIAAVAGSFYGADEATKSTLAASLKADLETVLTGKIPASKTADGLTVASGTVKWTTL